MTETSSIYDRRFYHAQGSESASSAAAVVPVLLDLFHPSSVLDVGCGTGTWLAQWIDLGVRDVQGVDGDYVDPSRLTLPRERFLGHDLQTELKLGRRFDLVTSLEVAEHLPAESASQFISILVHHGDVIVFSAAIPGQPGTQHVNCQWPSYWARLFAFFGYEPIDMVRPLIWDMRAAAPYYRQNILIFAGPGALPDYPRSSVAYIDFVHPQVYSDLALRPLRKVVEKRLRAYNIRTRLRSALRKASP